MIRIQMASCSEPGSRSQNEDDLCHGAARNGCYAVLADGAGGHSRGAEAAQRTVARIESLLVFVDVMKELPATLVLRPFDSDTLAVVAYQLARDERLGEAALPSLALVLVGLIPVMLLSRTLRSTAR